MQWVLYATVGFCTVAILHTYLFYPWWMLRQGRALPPPTPSPLPTDWPPVAVLMAVHNEERVLDAKLATLAAQDYPGRLDLYVGDDLSTDATSGILREYQLTAPNQRLHYSRNDHRLGKPGTINRLARAASEKSTIFVLTDASVMLRTDTIRELVRPLLFDAGLGLVDSRMVHTGARAMGIGRTEEAYIHREVAIKQAEGRVLGYPIGPFGGCWALRVEAFSPVPDNYLVDDFYLCMSAYRAGWRGWSSERAVVYEGVGQHMDQEFRRKVRIGSGNWQNLAEFVDLWWPPQQNLLAFAFFSHKILRWLTPLFLLLLGLCLLLLYRAGGNYWAGLLLSIAVGTMSLTALLDGVLSRCGVHLALLRSLHYFMAMNAALLVGFARYLTGINSNVWQPSSRLPPRTD